MDDKVSEMKNSLNGLISRLDAAEGRISKLYYRSIKISEKEEKKRSDYPRALTSLPLVPFYYFHCSIICLHINFKYFQISN